MHIALIAPPFLNIPPSGQGGTENVLSVKARELVRLGHQVTLFHAGQAHLRGIQHVQIFPKALNDLPQNLAAEESSRKLRLEMTYFALVADYLLKHDQEFDVIFNHTRGEVAFAPLTNILRTPLISVFHLPILAENITVLNDNSRAFAISISNNQRGRWKDLTNFIATVYNGVELAAFPMIERPKRDFLFWIGTIGEHKNPLDAILAAKRAGFPLVMAGKVRDQKYFNQFIGPHVDGHLVRYLGEINADQKLPYYQHARAVLFPTKWPEPFGLIMIEALACGTPVIAYPHGAVPEVIAPGQVGFIVHNPRQMATAIGKIDQIDRQACRDYIENHFSAQVMTQSYLAAAAKVIR